MQKPLPPGSTPRTHACIPHVIQCMFNLLRQFMHHTSVSDASHVPSTAPKRLSPLARSCAASLPAEVCISVIPPRHGCVWPVDISHAITAAVQGSRHAPTQTKLCSGKRCDSKQITSELHPATQQHAAGGVYAVMVQCYIVTTRCADWGRTACDRPALGAACMLARARAGHSKRLGPCTKPSALRCEGNANATAIVR